MVALQRSHYLIQAEKGATLFEWWQPQCPFSWEVDWMNGRKINPIGFMWSFP